MFIYFYVYDYNKIIKEIFSNQMTYLSQVKRKTSQV